MKNKNPWLTIPVSDYEGHMGYSTVRQLEFLNAEFAEAAAKYPAEEILYPGCTTGNGLEHINYEKVKRVTALDINREYLEVLKSRYSEYLNKIEVICADVNEYNFSPESFGLIHAALLFEYIEVSKNLEKMADWLKPGGVLTVILQLPNKNGDISTTPFKSLNCLEPVLKTITPDLFDKKAEEFNLAKIEGKEKTLSSGKRFYCAAYRSKK